MRSMDRCVQVLLILYSHIEIMKRIIVVAAIVLWFYGIPAQTHRDSIDIDHYALHLDINHLERGKHSGYATLTFHSLFDLEHIVLDLYASEVDSILYDNTKIEGYTLSRGKLYIPQPMAANDTARLTIHYKGRQTLEPYQWGGIHYDNNIIYNLGVAFQAYPHNFGRAWFPCIDSFTDKATYDFYFTVSEGKTLTCSGVRQSIQTCEDGAVTEHWRLDLPTPTYLVSFAISDYEHLQSSLQGIERTIPFSIYAHRNDTATVTRTAQGIQEGLRRLEECFGAYPFNRVGYCVTPKGSMEHVNNIALSRSVALDGGNEGKGVFLHELSHAWFGNLVTCSTSGDMFFNEGGASFCEEVAFEGLYGQDFAKQYARIRNKNLFLKLILDEGNFAIENVSPQYTYSSTIYQKGAAVFHGLRGYMGDSLFYGGLKQLFVDKAFGNISIGELEANLSDYSGMNLRPFFDFYLRDSGFTHYYSDSIVFNDRTATLYIKQNTRRSGGILEESHLPVTFFDSELQPLKKRISFTGSGGAVRVELPFRPVLACVDLDEEIFDATTDAYQIVSSDAELDMPEVYTKIDITTSRPTFVRSVLHWVGPDTPYPLPEGVQRISTNHYWTIEGNLSEAEEVTGAFYYARSNYQSYPFDSGFFYLSSQFDSLVLLYRADVGEPWQPVSCSKVGGIEGYIKTAHLQSGEYVIGMGNPALTLQNPTQGEVRPLEIYPNPALREIHIRLPYPKEDFEWYLTDMQGKKYFSEQKIFQTESDALLSLPDKHGLHTLIIYYPKKKETFSALVMLMD